jgi:hypothetical protein
LNCKKQAKNQRERLRLSYELIKEEERRFKQLLRNGAQGACEQLINEWNEI